MSRYLQVPGGHRTEYCGARSRLVVHDRGTLKTTAVTHDFPLEVQGAPAEPALDVVEAPVQWAGIDDRCTFGNIFAHLEVVGVQQHLDVRVRSIFLSHAV